MKARKFIQKSNLILIHFENKSNFILTSLKRRKLVATECNCDIDNSMQEFLNVLEAALT